MPIPAFVYPGLVKPLQYPKPLPVNGPIPMGPVPSPLGIILASPFLFVTAHWPLTIFAPHFGQVASLQGNPR